MTHTVISFEHSSYGSRRTPAVPGQPMNGSLSDVKAMKADLAAGKEVFVQFMRGSGGVHRKRLGSIARLVELKNNNQGYVSFQAKVEWDTRPNPVFVNHWDLAWLKGYTGPTHYIWTQDVDKRPDVDEVKDRLGKKIEVGDFVTYAVNTSGETDLMVGLVTKISAKGDVFCKNQNLGTEDKDPTSWGSANTTIKERLVKKPNRTLMVMTKDVVDRIVMAKLAR